MEPGARPTRSGFLLIGDQLGARNLTCDRQRFSKTRIDKVAERRCVDRRDGLLRMHILDSKHKLRTVGPGKKVRTKLLQVLTLLAIVRVAPVSNVNYSQPFVGLLVCPGDRASDGGLASDLPPTAATTRHSRYVVHWATNRIVQWKPTKSRCRQSVINIARVTRDS
jgi:hypothetical protein